MIVSHRDAEAQRKTANRQSYFGRYPNAAQRGRAFRFYSSPDKSGCGVTATIPNAGALHNFTASLHHNFSF